MRIDVDENRDFVLREVYSGVVLETAEGNRLGLAMRDDTVEITIGGRGRSFKVDFATGTIDALEAGP